MPKDLHDVKSTWAQVMAWCQEAITWSADASVDQNFLCHIVSLRCNELQENLS